MEDDVKRWRLIANNTIKKMPKKTSALKISNLPLSYRYYQQNKNTRYISQPLEHDNPLEPLTPIEPLEPIEPS